MNKVYGVAAWLLVAPILGGAAPAESSAPPMPTTPATSANKTMADILAAAKPEDWRTPELDNTVYLDVAGKRVVLELAPRFAPKHVANIKALIREGYFDGLVFMRSHDNYVVQFGDPDGKRPVRKAEQTLAAEFVRSSVDVPLVVLKDRDVYADEVGFVDGFPAARDGKSQHVWLAHCYGALGAGRDVDVNSGGGTELYVVIGHAPRHLDRNITLVGRVLWGMEVLSVMPRGTGALGFYEKNEAYIPIERLRIARDLPATERLPLEVFRTDTPAFTALVESRRNRRDDWYKVPAGHIELCNVPLPVRLLTRAPGRK